MVIRRSTERLSCLLLFVLVLGSSRGDHPPPVHLTSEQDLERTLGLLDIASLRRGPDGDPKSPNAANFDESKVSANLHLPDPLVLKSGEKVETAEVWWNRRRPEIVEDFDREIYGRVPEDTPKVRWEVVSAKTEENNGVPVITKKLAGHVDNSSYPPASVDIQLTLATPAKSSGPVPVMMEFGLRPEVYKSGKFKDMLSGSKKEEEITQEERDMVQALINETFQKFTQRHDLNNLQAIFSNDE